MGQVSSPCDGAAVLERLRAWLHETRLLPGDRLPPERTLCALLGLSRAELRKGLAVMEMNGELERRVGRGTFLQEPRGADLGRYAPIVAAGLWTGTQAPDLADLAERTSPHSAMMARMALEPQVAGLAAVHATQQQLNGLANLIEKMRGGRNFADYERLDARFHEAIGEASGNVLLAELQRMVNTVRVSVVWARLDRPDSGPPADYPSFAEHDAILTALERRDRVGAQAAMHAHLKSIRNRFLSED